jgi:hypothetical protein
VRQPAVKEPVLLRDRWEVQGLFEVDRAWSRSALGTHRDQGGDGGKAHAAL